MRLFSKCVAAYSKFYDETNGIQRVTAVSAVPIQELPMAKLKEKLERILSKTVIMTNIVDETCLGGIILRFSTEQIDGSIKGRLNQLKSDLSSAVL